MKLTHDQLAALPEYLREALASGPVTIERPVKEWEPEGREYVAGLKGIAQTTKVYSGGVIESWRAQGITRATEQQAERLAKDRSGYCLQHAYRDQYAPDYVEPPIGDWAYYVAINECGDPSKVNSKRRPLNQITMPEWLCQQLVADIKSGRYKL